MLRIYHKGIDISNITYDYYFSGDINQISRSFDFSLISSNDYYLKKIFINLGDLIQVFHKDRKIYEGLVFSKDSSSNSSSIQISSFDKLIYLNKNKATYTFKNLTPEEITAKVLGDFDIEVGKLEATGIRVNRLFQDASLYDIIQTVYSIANKKTNKHYQIKLVDGKVSVVELGREIAKYKLTDRSKYNGKEKIMGNILESSYSEDINTMVNKVKIYDENNNFIGEVENKSWIKDFGLMQNTYQKTNEKDAKSTAESMLEGINRQASLEVLGSFDLTVGNAVYIEEKMTNLLGKFYIIADEHTFEDGIHRTRLKLSFDKIMDIKEAGSD